MKKTISVITMLIALSSLFGAYQIGDTLSNLTWLESDGITTQKSNLDSIVNTGKPVLLIWGYRSCPSCMSTSGELQNLYVSPEFKDKVHFVYASTQQNSFEDLNGSGWRTYVTPNPTYGVSTRSQLGSSAITNLFSIKWVPYIAIIGRNKILNDIIIGGSIDLIASSLTTALNRYHLSLDNPIKDQAMINQEVKSFDLSSIFFSATETPQFKISANSDSTKVEAHINGNILTLNAISVGITKLKIKGWINGLSVYNEFYVQVDPSSNSTVTLVNNGFEEWPLVGWTNTGIPSIYEHQKWKLDSIAVKNGRYSLKADRRHIGNIILTLPTLNIPYGGVLDFYWRDNWGDSPSKLVTQDSTFAEISNDDGENWHKLAILSANDLERFFSHIMLDLTPFKGSSVMIRFRDWSTGTQYAVDTNIDDIKVVSYTTANITTDKIIKTTIVSNYPNPFNPTTNINFTIPQEDHVSITIYNANGELVSELLNEVKTPGFHSISFNGSNLNSGIYFYKVSTQSGSVCGKMMLIK